MLYIKFQKSEQSGSVEDFDFFLFIPNFKHLSQVVLKQKIYQYFSMYFYGSNLGPLARGHLGLWDLHLNKLVKGELGNATYQISNNWAKWF